MALPVSGPLGIDAIRTELGSTSGSLRALSALASFSTPDAISEFYGYSAAVDVYINAYMPSYVTCGQTYDFAATSSIAISGGGVTTTMNWYGDLGGFFQGSATIANGYSCGTGAGSTGSGVYCGGEYLTNYSWSMSPTSYPTQDYVQGSQYDTSIMPC
jgi:hypothetical protein